MTKRETLEGTTHKYLLEYWFKAMLAGTAHFCSTAPSIELGNLGNTHEPCLIGHGACRAGIPMNEEPSTNQLCPASGVPGSTASDVWISARGMITARVESRWEASCRSRPTSNFRNSSIIPVQYIGSLSCRTPPMETRDRNRTAQAKTSGTGS